MTFETRARTAGLVCAAAATLVAVAGCADGASPTASSTTTVAAAAAATDSSTTVYGIGLDALEEGSSLRTTKGTVYHMPDKADYAVRAAVEYMHDEITRNITLDELATASGASKYQLFRRFNAAIGVPPHAYQLALRVNLARRLLERGERATDVASLAGFVDQSHLNRHFRRRLGMTPAKYARSTRHPQP